MNVVVFEIFVAQQIDSELQNNAEFMYPTHNFVDHNPPTNPIQEKRQDCKIGILYIPLAFRQSKKLNCLS